MGVQPPLQIGLYAQEELVASFAEEGKTSESLPRLMQPLLKRYDLDAIYYARGPGSFMALKIIYIFLKTLSIVNNVPLKGADAFLFNGSAPIKAVGNSVYVKENGTITLQKSPNQTSAPFVLPQRLDEASFSDRCEPLYILPAV